MSDYHVAVTGASGFVGKGLVEYLAHKGVKLTSLGRTPCSLAGKSVFFDLRKKDFYVLDELRGADILIHCAARTHVMEDLVSNPLEEYLVANTHATLRLAEQAVEAGIKRFIYLSSVKVVGESTTGLPPLYSTSPIKPEDDYGVSKARAEEGLKVIAESTGMEVTIIRPPLVYGKGVKANFASLMSLAMKNLPLPLGSIQNKRSLVALQNLVDLIATCIEHENAGNKTFMVSDGVDVSTPELLNAITCAYGKKPRLIRCPPSILTFAARITGKKAIAERLLGSLQVDIEYTENELNWRPKVSMDSVLKEMVNNPNV